MGKYQLLKANVSPWS